MGVKTKRDQRRYKAALEIIDEYRHFNDPLRSAELRKEMAEKIAAAMKTEEEEWLKGQVR